MSSEVEICNLALSHLGDSATVASINPPEGSAQAEHCQRWYPVARDAVLELHDWGFATVRATLAELTNNWAQWQHTYAQPADCLKMLEILDPTATNDFSVAFPVNCYETASASRGASYTPQPFTTESDAAGNKIILTNQPGAIARYTRFITDTSKFSPLFRDTLAWYLAHYLAGPVLKGETGIAAGKAALQMAMGLLPQAKIASAQQQRQDLAHSVPWLAGR